MRPSRGGRLMTVVTSQAGPRPNLLRLLKGNPGKRPGTLTEPLPPSCTGPPIVILSPNGDVGMPSRGKVCRRVRPQQARGAPTRLANAHCRRRRDADRCRACSGAAGRHSRHRKTVNELLDAERERHKSELVSATRGLAIAKLEAAAGALELALATERGKVLDLPNPLKRVK